MPGSEFIHHDFETGRVHVGRPAFTRDPEDPSMPFATPLHERAADALVRANPGRYGGRSYRDLPAGHREVIEREAQAVIDETLRKPGETGPRFSLDKPHDSLTELAGQVAESLGQVDPEIRGFVFLTKGLDGGAVSTGYEWTEEGAATALGELLGNVNALGRVYGVRFGVELDDGSEQPEGVISPR